MNSIAERFRELPLGVKLPATITVIVYLVTLAMMSLIMVLEWKNMEARLKTQVLQIASVVGELAHDHLLRQDYWQAYDEMLHVLQDAPPGLMQVMVVVDSDGVVFVSSLPQEYRLGTRFEQQKWPESGVLLKRWDEIILASDPIEDRLERLGTVYYQVSLAGEFLEQRKLMAITFGLATLIAFLGAYVGLLISRRMTRPLNAMAAAVPMLERGEYHSLPEIPVLDRDEIGRLAQLFNQMRDEIRIRSEVERQVSRTERLSALGRLAVSAAHEIRNPLGGVMNSLKTLKKHGYDPAVRDRSVETMQSGLNQVNHIVSSMLGFSQEGSLEELLSHKGVVSLLTLLEIEASRKQIAVELQWLADEELPIPAAPLHQLIFNLASNGVQACSEGGAVLIWVEYHLPTTELIITVDDNGAGMPEVIKEHIFEPFWSAREGGSGLGLWVCCRIVSELDGVISVESSEGEGSRFLIRVPLNNRVGA